MRSFEQRASRSTGCWLFLDGLPATAEHVPSAGPRLRSGLLTSLHGPPSPRYAVPTMRALRLVAFVSAVSVTLIAQGACVGDDPVAPVVLVVTHDDGGPPGSPPPPSGDAAAEAGACGDVNGDPKNCGACGHLCSGENKCYRG